MNHLVFFESPCCKGGGGHILFWNHSGRWTTLYFCHPVNGGGSHPILKWWWEMNHPVFLSPCQGKGRGYTPFWNHSGRWTSLYFNHGFGEGGVPLHFEIIVRDETGKEIRKSKTIATTFPLHNMISKWRGTSPFNNNFLFLFNSLPQVFEQSLFLFFPGVFSHSKSFVFKIPANFKKHLIMFTFISQLSKKGNNVFIVKWQYYGGFFWWEIIPDVKVYVNFGPEMKQWMGNMSFKSIR